MSTQLKVYCKNVERYIPFEGGATLTDIYESIADELPERPICSQVNTKTQAMQVPLF